MNRCETCGIAQNHHHTRAQQPIRTLGASARASLPAANSNSELRLSFATFRAELFCNRSADVKVKAARIAKTSCLDLPGDPSTRYSVADILHVLSVLASELQRSAQEQRGVRDVAH